jgi:hypothetical protein
MLCATPQRAEPTRKTTSATCSTFAPVEIAELAVQRPDYRRGEQVGGHDPGQVLQSSEVADDRRERRRHDRLVERRDEQHEE